MPIPQPAIIFLSIILITGGLTIFTDLRSKKIYNNHLAICAVLGLSALLYAAFRTHENILFHILNGSIAFVIGYIFHRLNLWRGGDAKLFALYAFLMPALGPEHMPLSNTISLFACSFIMGLIIIIPLFIIDIASNYTLIAATILNKRWDMMVTIRSTIIFSWVVFPFYHLAHVFQIPVISLAMTYIIFYLCHRFLLQSPKNFLLAAILIGAGFLERLWLNPESLFWPALPLSIFKICFFSILSACIYTILGHLKEYQDRIAFAPVLFMGCMLSYTPFLTWVMHFLQVIRR